MDYGQRFELLVGYLLQEEGGYVFNPDDPGGETNYGISKRSYPNLDIQNLDLPKVKEVYYKDFYAPLYGDSLPGPAIAVMFDSAVNQGKTRAITLAQRAAAVYVDGILGPETRFEIEGMDPARFAYLFTRYRIKAYVALDNFKNFGNGWIDRSLRTLLRAKEVT